ncbi:MAG: NADH-quinone oxidoreductase subunit H [Actinomycetota bacterium]|nr:NADH-quinone oxidoreductase subunit H [Actinomycetota bacterium]
MTLTPVWWTLAFLLVFATLAASVHGALAARTLGASPGVGALLPATETARLLRQDRRTLLAADSPLWRIGGAGLALIPLLMAAVIPFGPPAVLDSPIGIVWFNTADVVVWALVWLLGWGANSTYALVGAFRFLATALAYELPLMFALTTPAVAASSLRVSDVVAAQHGLWYVVWMPVAFLVTLLGVVGFSVWGPLSPAAAPDLAGGVLAELSGPDRLLASAGRYLLLTAGSAFATALFLGGTQGPLLPGWAWMSLKTLVVVVALVAVRGRLALLRPDRFLEVGWLVLLPLALAQLLVVSLVVAS